MGMRASLIYRGTNRDYKSTSIQWSTILDMSLGYYLSQFDTSEEKITKTHDLFANTVHKYDHVSSIEITHKENKTIGLTNPIERVKGIHYKPHNAMELMPNHLDGGSLGALYDVNKPDKITFFYYDNQGVLITKNCGIEALSKYYADFYNKKKPLKKMAHRSV